MAQNNKVLLLAYNICPLWAAWALFQDFSIQSQADAASKVWRFAGHIGGRKKACKKCLPPNGFCPKAVYMIFAHIPLTKQITRVCPISKGQGSVISPWA